MQLERRVLGNAASLGLSEILGQLANFGFVILVARGFGRDVFAQYAFAMAIGAMICTFVSFGSIALLIRSSAQNQARGLEMLGVVLPVQFILGVAVLAVTVAGGVFANLSADDLRILVIIVAHNVALRITAVVLTQLQGMERMDIIAALRIGRSLVTVIAALTIALSTGNAILAIACMPIASVLFLLVACGIVKKMLGPLALKWDIPAALRIAFEALPFFATAMLNTAGNRIGILLLGGIQGNDAVATYASGERIISAAAILYSMLSAATLPAASQLALVDRARHIEVINRLTRVVMLLVLPVATLLFLFSGDIIMLLFGQDFLSSVPILQVIAAVLAVRALISIQVMAATSVGHQRYVLIGGVVALILLVSTGIPLIRLAGPLGLACAVLVAEIGKATALYLLLRRAGIRIALMRLTGATAVGCGLALALGILLPEVALIPRAMVIVGCMVVAFWALGAVREHDIRYFLAILKTSRSDKSGSA